MKIHHLSSTDIPLMHGLLAMFGEAFNERDTYTGNAPSEAYFTSLLRGESFIALAAIEKDQVVGGLAAYELRKFEQERSEIYIYDLAVLEAYRRRGVATALIEKLKAIGAERGAYVLLVQADTGEEDQAAIALYSKLGEREDVLHFDIPV